jgi:hypothetical protein
VYLPGSHIPDKKAMAVKTQDHIARGTPVICEAAFCNYNNYCAVDILRKTESGYDFYEVKMPRKSGSSLSRTQASSITS